MTTIKEHYQKLKQETLENYCQKLIDKCVKNIWKNEKHYLSKFGGLICGNLEPHICLHTLYKNYNYSSGVNNVNIKKPDSFFEYYIYNESLVVECLSKIMADSKLPKDMVFKVYSGLNNIQIQIILL